MLAAKLGQNGLHRLVRMGAVPPPVFTAKQAFKAPIGESNAAIITNRAALGKQIETFAYLGMHNFYNSDTMKYPELAAYVAQECCKARREVTLKARVGDFVIAGSADFVFINRNYKRILSEYKISLCKSPNAGDYLQAIIYALIYNRCGGYSRVEHNRYPNTYIDGVEWFNPITGYQCQLITTPAKLRAKDNLEKIISVYVDIINTNVIAG